MGLVSDPARQAMNSDADISQSTRPVKRVGMVIEIRPEHLAEYRRIHADGHAGVRDLLTRYHLRNFSIFLHQIDGRWLEFGYYEYDGDDFEGDMARLGAEPRNREWLAVCDSMQQPLAGETGWAVMEQIYHNG
jgi:L-rhamnose mutarotase